MRGWKGYRETVRKGAVERRKGAGERRLEKGGINIKGRRTFNVEKKSRGKKTILNVLIDEQMFEKGNIIFTKPFLIICAISDHSRNHSFNTELSLR